MRRSTRNKMRYQAKQILNKVEVCFAHLSRLEELAQGQSPIVNDFLPQYKELLSQVHSLFVDLRDRL